jgi:hypothetical protein
MTPRLCTIFALLFTACVENGDADPELDLALAEEDTAGLVEPGAGGKADSSWETAPTLHVGERRYDHVGRRSPSRSPRPRPRAAASASPSWARSSGTAPATPSRPLATRARSRPPG